MEKEFDSGDSGDRLEVEREEMLDQLEDLRARAEKLRDQLQGKPLPVPVLLLRLFLLFGVPVLAGIGGYLQTSSVLFAILFLLGSFAVVLSIAFRLAPGTSHKKIGTISWEAKMNVDLLHRVIAEREAAHRTASDSETTSYLERELCHLYNELEKYQAIAHSGDSRLGRGYVGYDAYKE